jgi:phage terminase large subunit-like protein
MTRLPGLAQVQAERAKRDFRYYIRQAWPVIEPATLYLHNWHIDIIAEYLTAITDGTLRNLIINIPPRGMKSILVSVLWPTWIWTHSPSKRIVSASASTDLVIRDAVKSRRVIQSHWYQARFGNVFQLTGDQNVKSRYENDKTGFRFSVSVGGAVTGEGGDILTADDPLKAQDANSDAQRLVVNDWWDQTMSTRGNDPKKVARLIIMQRLHTDDLTGHVLAKMKEEGAEQYEHLCLPMEYEPKRFFSSIGLNDPRTQPGELLWPERFGATEVEALKASLGSMGAAGQLQQRPAPVGGSIYLVEWWQDQARFRPTGADVVARWLSFDTANKDGEENAHTALSVFELLTDYRLFTREVSWKKLQFPQLAAEIEAQAWRWMADGLLRGIIIEDKASGTSALQTLAQSSPPEIARLLVAYMPSGSKVARARQASLWCERGCVLLPEPGDPAYPWLYDFEHEHLYKFPVSAFLDPEDSFSQGILYLENIIAEGWQARTHPPTIPSNQERGISKRKSKYRHS